MQSRFAWGTPSPAWLSNYITYFIWYAPTVCVIKILQMPSHQEIYVIIKYNSSVTAVPEGWQYAAYIFFSIEWIMVSR